jgi:hypothetical protein
VTLGVSCKADDRKSEYQIPNFVTPKQAASAYAKLQSLETALPQQGLPIELAPPHDPLSSRYERIEKILTAPFEPVELTRRWWNDLFGWVPLSTVSGGADFLGKLRSLAISAEPFGCSQGEFSGNPENVASVGHVVGVSLSVRSGVPPSPSWLSCLIVVKSSDVPSKSLDYSFCEIQKIQTVLGPPEHCIPVAVEGSTNAWIFAKVGILLNLSASLGRVDFSLHLFPGRTDTPDVPDPVHISTRIKDDSLFAALQSALHDPPLQLTTASEDFISEGRGRVFKILGTADFRRSPVLPDFRERVTIRVDTLEEHDTGNFTMEVSTTLYLSNLNSTDYLQWTLPSPQQEATYLDKVRDRLRSALASLCSKPSWKDDYTLDCR